LAQNTAPTLGAGSSQLLYEVTNPVRVNNNIVYAVDNSTALASTTFNRVRYRMETTVQGTTYYAEASFDSWSGLTVAGLKVPTPNAAGVIQRSVTNLTVDSNYSGVVKATNQSGRLEIWDSNYEPTATSGIGGNGSTYDFDDTPTPGTYGSFKCTTFPPLRPRPYWHGTITRVRHRM